MTGSTDRAGSLLGGAWREETLAQQSDVLPPGRVVVSCGVPYGDGGLGHHLAEIMAALERAGRPGSYLALDNRRVARAKPGPVERLRARLSPGRRLMAARVEFDAYAASELPAGDSLMAFNRQALAQFAAARAAGYGSVALVTGSPHVARVARQHGLAYDAYPIERSFGTFIVQRYLDEYEQADAIYVASRYTWDSFLEQGFEESRLRLFPLTPDARFTPGEGEGSATFDVVYAGALSVAKGVPLLIDAFRALDHPDIRLRLIGNAKSRPMARWIERAVAGDSRISAGPADPLSPFRDAALCVHPAYEDGFAYAPAEALACGTPVLVSADTGMKDLVIPGVTGDIVPTGDRATLSEALDAAYRGELLRDG